MQRIICACLTSILLFACSSSKYLTKNNDQYELTTSQVNWILSFPSSDLSLEVKKSNPQGTSVYHMFTNKKTGLIVSFFIEPAIEFEDPVSYRDKCLNDVKQLHGNAANLIKKEFAEYALLEYLVPEFLGRKIDQQNMNAMYVRDDYWIDLHLSKVDFKEGEQKLFYDFINSVKFQQKIKSDKYVGPQDSVTQTALKYFLKGNAAYIKKDYKTAINWYQKTLDQENKQPTLESDYWHVLVDNLGMAYGISGKLVKAREIFDFGLSKDPAYPMFYYNLACTFAEMDNLDKCLENLRKAYQYRANMIQGEVFPDPRSDSSFQKYLNNPEFLKVLAEITAQ
jgi:tetratricopeptide (TPR) repeat protein